MLKRATVDQIQGLFADLDVDDQCLAITAVLKAAVAVADTRAKCTIDLDDRYGFDVVVDASNAVDELIALIEPADSGAGASPAALPRLDGRTVWRTLEPDDQEDIGALAIELVAAYRGMENAGVGDVRPYEAADAVIHNALYSLVSPLVPGLDYDEPTPIPRTLGRVCRVCKCSHTDPCDPPCGWAEEDLCTACAAKQEERCP